MRKSAEKNRSVRVDVDKEPGTQNGNGPDEQSEIALTIVPATLNRRLLQFGRRAARREGGVFARCWICVHRSVF
jgi:hypothetical protein